MDDFAFSDDPHDDYDDDSLTDDESAAYLPPARTMSDMIRQLSEEGKKLLVAGLNASVPASPETAVRRPSAALKRAVETELEDIAAVFGRRAVGPLSAGDDASLRVQLRLKFHGFAVSASFVMFPDYPVSSPLVTVLCPKLDHRILGDIEAACRESLADITGSPALMSFCLSLETMLQPYENAPSPPRALRPSRASGGAAAGAPPQPPAQMPVASSVVREADMPPEAEAPPALCEEPLLQFQPVGVRLSVNEKGCPGELWGAAAFSLGGKLYVHGGLAPPEVFVEELMNTPVFDLIPGSFARKYHNRVGIRDLLVKHVAVAGRTPGSLISTVSSTMDAHLMDRVREHVRAEAHSCFYETKWFYALKAKLSELYAERKDKDTIWEFDPVRRTWRLFATGVQARHDHQAVVVSQNRVLLLGGSLTALKVDKFITVVEFQSTGGITTRNAPCDAIAKMQSACRLPSTSSVILYGGAGVTDPLSYHVFNSGTNHTVKVTCHGKPPSFPLTRHSASCSRNTMVVFGGVQGSMKSNDMFGLDLEANIWSPIQFTRPSTFIPQRADQCFLRLSADEFVVFGGEGFGDVALDDIFMVKLDHGDSGIVATAKKMSIVSQDKKAVFHSPRIAATAAAVGSFMWIFGGHKFLSSPFQKRAVTHCTDMLGIRLLPESEVPVAGSTLSQDFSSLLSAVDLADVIIECKDGSIFAHKAVLGMRCPYFLRCFVTNTVRSTLTETGVDMTVFEFPDVFCKTMKVVLTFLYTGGYSASTSLCDEIIAACRLLELESSQLMSHCVSTQAASAWQRAPRVELVVPPGKIPNELARDFVNSLPAFRNTEGPEEVDDGWDPTPLCDISLVSGEFSISAHKCMLAARSALFASYIRSEFSESKSSSWLMDDALSPEDLQCFVEFLYTDKVSALTLDSAMALIRLGGQHELLRLVNLCEKFIIAAMDFEDPESTLALLCFALDVGVVATHLKSRCLYHILHTIPRNNLNRTMDEIGKEMPDSALRVIRVALRTGEWA